MATSFKGWGTSWGNSWGPIASDPNAMIGAAGFTLTAVATLTSGISPGEMSASASLTFSAIGILTDANAYPDIERRPKSTNTLKLQRIKEGRATALSAKALTHARPAQAKGESPAPVIPSAPGHVLCTSARAGTVTRALRTKGAASASATGRIAGTRGQVVGTGAGARVTCQGPRARGAGARPPTYGAARASLRPFVSFSSHTEATARGVQNLSDAQVAAVIRATIDRRR